MGYRQWRANYPTMIPDLSFTNISPIGYDPSIWMCDRNYSATCTKQAALTNASNWKVTLENIPIDYCLSKKTAGEVCRLEYSGIIFAVIICCDAIKVLVAALTLTRVTETPLVTIGDAIAAFLKDCEGYTKGRCLLDQDSALEHENIFWLYPLDFSPVTGDGTVAQIWPELFGPRLMPWQKQTKKWAHAASWKRWMSLCIV
jgi:hypothetical protein